MTTNGIAISFFNCNTLRNNRQIVSILESLTVTYCMRVVGSSCDSTYFPKDYLSIQTRSESYLRTWNLVLHWNISNGNMSDERSDSPRTECTHLPNEIVRPSSYSTERVSKRLKMDNSDQRFSSCPLVEKKLDYSNPQRKLPASISLNPTIDDLMGGEIPPDVFLTSIFRKQAAHITCIDSSQDEIHRKTRVGALCNEMYDLDIETILRESSSENIFLWLRDFRNGTPAQATGEQEVGIPEKTQKPGALIRQIEVPDVETAMALYKTAGHATYCRAPPKVEQSLVASLLQATGLGCGQYDPSGASTVCLGRGEVETFVSTANHVTNWHYDFQNNFTIQLSGTKRWTLQQGTIMDPLLGCTPHYASPEVVESQLTAAYLHDRKFSFGTPKVPTTAEGDVRSIFMKPGDVLYFPAGMWHKVETIEPGVSINVSLMATNYATLVSQALCHFLHRDPRFREPVVNNGVTNATHSLQTLLQELPGLVRHFSKVEGGGAHDILPPVLQHPPLCFMTEEQDEEEVNEEEVEIDVQENEMPFREDENGEGNDDGNVVDNSQSENRRAESVDWGFEDDGEILDPADFTDYGTSWDFQLEMGSKIAMYKNPIGALHKVEELTSFYKTREGKESASEAHAFVLNINFAGNQMHESTIRVVFRDNEEGLVRRLWEQERYSEDQSDSTPLDYAVVTETNHYLISFLVYHGYMQVKKV